MALLPIYNCFHPVLKKKTEEITEVNKEMLTLIDDMYETMHIAEGVGLAANQVGISKSLIVIDIGYFYEKSPYLPLTMINPQITAFSDEEIDYEEGCLSVPTLRETVIRPSEIEVKFLDKDLKEKTMQATELLARVMQHEIDHLNGILFFEKLSPIRKTLSQNKLKKIKKGVIVPDYPMVMADGKLIQ